MDNNIVLDTDSYKMTHWQMYPENTTEVFSYFESRAGAEYPETVFFGLQYLLNKHLQGQVVTLEKIEEAEQFCFEHFGDAGLFNKDGWLHVLEQHGGRLPVEIRAVPEGSIVPTSNVLFTIRNTDPSCAWLTNHLETLLVECWYPSTIATSSFVQLRTLTDYATRMGMNASYEALNLKLHDFGFRGSSSIESSALGGAAHLIPFLGTDNIVACRLIDEYYGLDEGVAGISIPAAEHSTVTSHENEVDAYRQILQKYAFVSVVSDSYDYWNALTNIWGGALKAEVEKFIADGKTLVIRPDSGDPINNVVESHNILGHIFGYTTNGKGFRSLPRGLNIIQGDGINHQVLDDICHAMYRERWTMENLAFGSGGGLLQNVNRDTQKFAMKCSSAVIGGKRRDVFKSPKTDPTKASKRGLLDLVNHDAGTGKKSLGTVESLSERNYPAPSSAMQMVFRDGKAVNHMSFDDVRKTFLGDYRAMSV